MRASPLSLDVYVSPMRPYNCPDQFGEGEVATWAPSSSTLISGPAEGILIDALLTLGNADEIAAWAMLDLHGERDQPHTLWISARAEVARRGVNDLDVR
jgi:hypothetical protein